MWPCGVSLIWLISFESSESKVPSDEVPPPSHKVCPGVLSCADWAQTKYFQHRRALVIWMPIATAPTCMARLLELRRLALIGCGSSGY